MTTLPITPEDAAGVYNHAQEVGDEFYTDPDNYQAMIVAAFVSTFGSNWIYKAPETFDPFWRAQWHLVNRVNVEIAKL